MESNHALELSNTSPLPFIPSSTFRIASFVTCPMEDTEFYRLVRREERAREYFEKIIWRKEWRKCPFCRSTRPYALSSGRFRCRGCRQDFRSWTGRWIGRLRIQASHWLWIIKCFESEWTPLYSVKKVGLSYPTLLRAYHVIREAILSSELRASAPPNLGPNACPPVSINEIEERMVIAYDRRFDPRSLKPKGLRGCRKGNFIALEKCGNNDWLILYDDRSKACFDPKSCGAVNGDHFRKFAIARLNRYHGVTAKYLAHYLNEVVFRYNHRHGDLFGLVAQAIAEPVQVADDRD